MSLVIDPSALLGLAFEDEKADYASSVLNEIERGGGLVPAIFWFEVRHVLVVNEWRERLTSEQTDVFLNALAELPLEVAPPPSDLLLLDLARNHRLSVYDAAYLGLAHQEGASLATLDKRLRRVSRDCGVAVYEIPAS